MVGGHRVDGTVGQPAPQGGAVRPGTQGRGHNGLQALLGVAVGLLGEGEILGAGLHPEVPLPGGPGLAHLRQPGGAGQVHHVHRRLPGQGGQVEQAAHRLRLAPGGAASGVVDGGRQALGPVPAPQEVHHPVVLAVGGDDQTVLLGLPEHLEQGAVVQAVVIGQIGLEAGDALPVGNLPHLPEDLTVHVLEHPVETVVDHRLPVSQAVVLLHLVPQGAALGPEGHVIHNGGGAAAGGGHGAGVEVVHRPVGPGLEIHVGVHVHPAGQDVFPGGVDALGAPGVQVFPHRLDHAVFHKHIGGKDGGLGDHGAVLDDGAHRPPPRLFRSASNKKCLRQTFFHLHHTPTASPCKGGIVPKRKARICGKTPCGAA